MNPMLERNTEASGGRRLTGSKGIATLLVDAATANSSLTNPAILEATPKDTNGFLDTQDFPLVRLKFGGSTAADQHVNYQVITWSPMYVPGPGNGKMWMPTIVASGVYTLGATALPTWMYSTNGKFADTITQTVDSDATFHSPADDSIAWLDVPVDNAQFISVETNRDTSAATADVIATLGEDSGTDPTVAALTLIRNQLSPNVITPQAEQASTSSFVGLAIPAGTVYAHVSVETTNAFVAPTPADSGPAQEGTSYKVNGAWNIACRDAAFLRIKRDGGSDGTVGVTFFGN